MERPNFEDYLPKDTTAEEIQRMFKANESLYNYIQALDSYIDSLVNQGKTKIAEYIEKRSQKAWDTMGNTGADDYTETCTKQEYFNFGQFRAFEDIQRFIKKL